MELRHLRYFCAVAEYGTFSKAGAALHVSQSAISEQIADLEREIGGALLERKSRLTRLTPHGQLFLAEAKKMLLAAEQAVDMTRRSLQGQIGTLAIGFFLWGSGDFFSRIIRDYRKLHPDVRLSLYEMHATIQIQSLLSGKIDVGFTRPLEPPFDKALRAELLYRDPLMVALPLEHPLAGKTVAVKELARERWVMLERDSNPTLFDSVLSLCSGAGFAPEITYRSSGWPSLLTLVESGEGIALVPSGVRYLATPGLVFCELEAPTTSVGVSIAWNPARESAVLLNFLELVRKNKDRIRKPRNT
jgi:DNA-binding transcriptional LysR family regulator